jgi:23S rRNA pseudouridine1911/1915/1917 synthase
MQTSKKADGETFSFEVEPQEAGVRLDLLAATRVPELSRGQASLLIQEGLIRAGGRIRKPGYRVRDGETINGTIPPPSPVSFLPEAIPLDILYEDRDLIVINKAAGIVVHPAPGHPDGTLVNGLLHHCPDLEGIGGELRPGIVHRLDRDTSGALVVAKNGPVHTELARQFKSREVGKIYVALVYGGFSDDSGTISLPIGRHPVARKKMSTASRQGREAETEWRVLERFDRVTLLELGLKTGRTHQIRVHCAAMGRPVFGDPVYGGGNKAAMPAGIGTVHRQMLHARRLSLTHPRTGERMTFEAPLPADFKRLLDRLRQGGDRGSR